MNAVRDIIANAIRPGLQQHKRAAEAAEQVIAALTSAGYVIARRGSAGRLTVEPSPRPRPLMTNAVAGEPARRGVSVRSDA